MVDTGIWYIDGNTKTQTNDGTLLFTNTSPSRNGAVVWSTYHMVQNCIRTIQHGWDCLIMMESPKVFELDTSTGTMSYQ